MFTRQFTGMRFGLLLFFVVVYNGGALLLGARPAVSSTPPHLNIVYRTDVPPDQRDWRWRVVEKEVGPDGNIRIRYEVFIHPNENPENPGYDEYQYEKRIRQAYSDVVEEGAAKVERALKAYAFVAEQFMTGPLYNLAGHGLVALATKADDLLRAASALQAIAGKLRGAADDVLALVRKLEAQLGNAAAEAKAALQASIAKLQQGIAQLRGAADDAHTAALHMDDAANKAKQGVESVQAADNAVQTATGAGRQVHIDVGGEGRYADAINLNPEYRVQFPNQVRGVGQRMPFKSHVADHITIENTLATPGTAVDDAKIASEIARVIKSGGQIVLEHAENARSIAFHDEVTRVVGGTVTKSQRWKVIKDGVEYWVIRKVVTAP